MHLFDHIFFLYQSLAVVFMGMGDAGRNLDAVQTAVECLVDRHRFSFAQSKVQSLRSAAPL